MRSWKKTVPEPGVSPIIALIRQIILTFALVCAPAVVSAAGVLLQDFKFAPGEDTYELSVSADFELSPAVEKLLERGVTLTLRAEVEIQRPRWYWFNERVARKVHNYRLSYQSLTRHYRVAIGDVQQSYPTLREALSKVSHIRQWPVVERKELSAGTAYDASFRYYLDISQLPKPLQVTAFTNSEWELSAEPRQWTFIAEGK